jgi:hypothetical protein
VLLLSGALVAGCGAGAGSTWYYHWNCNGDSECLATNPTGAASGTLDEGPNEVNCTQLMVFASHFWGPSAFNSCDQSASFDGGGGAGTSAPRISSFTPTSTSPGATLTLAGTNFVVNGTTVLINGGTCAITSATTTQIVCVVPNVNDFVGPITITTAKGFSNSTTNLTVTHPSSVYWSAYNDGSLLGSFTGGIWQASKAGSPISTVKSSLADFSRLAADSRYLYYTQTAASGWVGMVDIRTGASGTVAGGLAYPDAVAVDASAVYWLEANATQTGTVVKKVVLPGGTPVVVAAQPPGLFTCASAYCVKHSGLAIDATNVYWGQRGAIYRAPIAGGSITLLAARDAGSDTEVAIDAGTVYWVDPTSIGAVPKVGGPATTPATGLSGPSTIAVQAGTLYWSEGTSIKKMVSSGGPITTVATTSGPATGMAVDSTSLYWIDGMSIRKVGLDAGAAVTLANPVYGPPRSLVVDLP